MAGRHEIQNKLKGETLVRKGLTGRRAGIGSLRLVPVPMPAPI